MTVLTRVAAAVGIKVTVTADRLEDYVCITRGRFCWEYFAVSGNWYVTATTGSLPDGGLSRRVSAEKVPREVIEQVPLDIRLMRRLRDAG